MFYDSQFTRDRYVIFLTVTQPTALGGELSN